MFPGNYFPKTYYPPRYFPKIGGTLARICSLGTQVFTGSLNVVMRQAVKLNTMVRCPK